MGHDSNIGILYQKLDIHLLAQDQGLFTFLDNRFILINSNKNDIYTNTRIRMKKYILSSLLVLAFANSQVNAMNLQNTILKKVVIFTPAVIGTIYGCKNFYDAFLEELKFRKKFNNAEVTPIQVDEYIEERYKKIKKVRIALGLCATSGLLYYCTK